MASGRKTGGGSRKGRPNILTRDIKEMILAALEGVGGQEYLQRQAEANPAAFMTLLGKVLLLQVTGKDGGPPQYQSIDAPAKETREEWLARQQAERAAVH